MIIYKNCAEIEYRQIDSKSKYFQFVNLIGALGCNHLTIYGFMNASKYNWKPDSYNFKEDWYDDLMLGLKHILANDGDYAQVGWVQLSDHQKNLIPEVKEKLEKWIIQETKVPAGHNENGSCTLLMIDLKRIRYEQ